MAHGKIALHGWESPAIVSELARPRTFAELEDALDSPPKKTIELFLIMLINTGFVSVHSTDQPYPGENETLAQWEFHDLLFHARSRLGRHANPFGGTLSNALEMVFGN